MKKCAICSGSLIIHRYYDFKSIEFKEIYKDKYVYRCSLCGLSQVNTQSIDGYLLSEYYINKYRVVSPAGAKSKLTTALWRQRALALSRLSKKYLRYSPEKIFEVGAGYGLNLTELKNVFPDAQIFTDEPSRLTTQNTEIRTAALEDSGYDLIIMSHVLEHFEDPKCLLLRVEAALNRGGIAIIEVPNDIDNIERYNGPDEPHLLFFEKESLSTLLQSVRGLDVIDIFEAGPSIVPLNIKRYFRRKISKFIFSFPIIGNILTTRAAHRVSKTDFYQRNDRGIFLRAILKK